MCESISIQYSCFDFSDMSISTLSKHISVSVYNGQSKQTPLLLDKTHKRLNEPEKAQAAGGN